MYDYLEANFELIQLCLDRFTTETKLRMNFKQNCCSMCLSQYFCYSKSFTCDSFAHQISTAINFSTFVIPKIEEF